MDQRYKLLTRLAACAPRALAESHTPALRELHDGAVAVGLTGRLPVAAAAKARLHALFDVALEHGLVAVITHFVQEVHTRLPPYRHCHPQRSPLVSAPVGMASSAQNWG
jgi:hypothetical protein